MKKCISKSLLMTTLITGMCIGGAQGVFAAEALQEFTLDPMIVTATRTEKRDLDVPATTSVISNEQLVDTGATTVENALRFATGITFKSETIGEGNGEIMIRGKRRGTLVMVDGVPLNFRTGYYNLDNINIDDVERVEIVRGGGAVLYGSDTTGGVINIIMKNKRSNSISVSAGNYGVQKHQTSLQLGKLGFGASWEKKGAVDAVTYPASTGKFFDFLGGEKTIFSANYRFDDALKMNVDYSNHDYARRYNNKDGSPSDERHYDNDRNRFTLNYNKDGWNATAYYNQCHIYYPYHYWTKGEKFKDARIYDYEDMKKGIDVTKQFDFEKDTLIIGAKVENESYEFHDSYDPGYKVKAPIDYQYDRNIYSVFAQLDHKFDDKNNVIIGARETWTGSSPDGTNYSEFTPQIQYLYKMRDDLSVYASVSKSFTLPTMNDMYGMGDHHPNPDIKPEVGMHYEAGLKHISGDHSWKLAVFKSDVKDFITEDSDLEMAVNEDNRNIGIELSSEVVNSNGFSANWGISYGNPEYRDADTNYQWHRNYGRLQANAGLKYQANKFNIALNASYLYDRVYKNSQEAIKPFLLTTAHVSYSPTKDHEIFLNVDNMLDRIDITSHVSSRYKTLGTNFVLGYKYKF